MEKTFNKNKLKVVALIPARGGSKGISRKNIRPIAGHSLIAWLIQQAWQTQFFLPERLVIVLFGKKGRIIVEVLVMIIVSGDRPLHRTLRMGPFMFSSRKF